MAVIGLAISGRLVEGETLKAAALPGITGLQWQALFNGNWVNVGTANSATFTIPAGAAGTAYRVLGSSATGSYTSEATLAATVDTRKAAAPVLSGSDLAVLSTENVSGVHLFNWLTVSDADKTNFGGGSLLISDTTTLASGGDGHDQLSIQFGGSSAFTYNAATREISYPGANGHPMVIGTVDAALNGQGSALKVTFNSNATVAIVDALTDNLLFANNDDSPVEHRLITLRITDPTGARRNA